MVAVYAGPVGHDGVGGGIGEGEWDDVVCGGGGIMCWMWCVAAVGVAAWRGAGQVAHLMSLRKNENERIAGQVRRAAPRRSSRGPGCASFRAVWTGLGVR